MFIRQNVLTEDELKKALELQKGSGKKIGEVLVDNGFITEDMIVRALNHSGSTGESFGMPFDG